MRLCLTITRFNQQRTLGGPRAAKVAAHTAFSWTKITVRGVIWTRTLSLQERKSFLAFTHSHDAKSRDRGGGVQLDKKTGKMEKMGDSKSDSTLLNNLRDEYPVILLVGQ